MAQLPKHQSFFLFGARQTGKSTLIQSRYPNAWVVNLLNQEEYLSYLRDYSLFRQQAKKKIAEGVQQIFIDEVQRAPELLNEVQSLMMEHKHVQFILTGSSSRKLKRGGANLLAGRAVVYYLYPFVYNEISQLPLEEILHWGTPMKADVYRFFKLKFNGLTPSTYSGSTAYNILRRQGS